MHNFEWCDVEAERALSDKLSPEIIRLAVMLYVRFLLSLGNVEDLLHERGIEISL